MVRLWSLSWAPKSGFLPKAKVRTLPPLSGSGFPGWSRLNRSSSITSYSTTSLVRESVVLESMAENALLSQVSRRFLPDITEDDFRHMATSILGHPASNRLGSFIHAFSLLLVSPFMPFLGYSFPVPSSKTSGRRGKSGFAPTPSYTKGCSYS